MNCQMLLSIIYGQLQIVLALLVRMETGVGSISVLQHLPVLMEKRLGMCSLSHLTYMYSMYMYVHIYM